MVEPVPQTDLCLEMPASCRLCSVSAIFLQILSVVAGMLQVNTTVPAWCHWCHATPAIMLVFLHTANRLNISGIIANKMALAAEMLDCTQKVTQIQGFFKSSKNTLLTDRVAKTL